MRLNALVSIISLAVSILVIECACRWIGVDFNRYNYNPIPICYRMPTVPAGEVFFRRPGPASWHGKVFKSAMRFYRCTEADSSYPDEAPLTITYDDLGFRNPASLSDYEIAIAGDSFTELGYLSYEDLFSTRVGRLLGLRVKNLGVSSTSSLTQAYYLKEYGRSHSIKHVIMVFFEGNDLSEGVGEMKEMSAFRSTGRRPRRELKNNNSFIWAVLRLGKRLFVPYVTRHSCENAYLETAGGRIPVTVFYAPTSRDRLRGEEKAFLDTTFMGLANAAKEMGAEPWIVYMPCKERVFYGHLKFKKNADSRIVEWKPTDLPSAIEEYAKKYNIGFIDVTPDLIKETGKMKITYNTIFDSHLNRYGSIITARVIADRLRSCGHVNMGCEKTIKETPVI